MSAREESSRRARLKRSAKTLLKMEKRLRDEDKRIESDDLVFLTCSPKDFDFYLDVLKLVQPTRIVLDPDKGVRVGRVLLSRVRADRIAAGDT